MPTRGLSSDSVLRIANYRRLVLSRFISNLGNGMAPIALAFGVLAIPGTDATSLSIVLAAQAIPVVLVLPIGGVIADRVGRARVIYSADAVLGLVVMTIAVLFLTGAATVPLLAILGALAGCLEALWWPAYTGMVPDTVEDAYLQPANAYLSVASNSGLIIGSALGGLLVALIGPGLAVAFDATTFLVSSALVFTIRHLSRPHDSGESMLGDLGHGWRVFISYRWVVVVVAAYSLIVMASRGAEEVLGPVLAVQEYGGAAGWALVLSAQSAGLLFGALAATRIRARRPMVLGMLITFTITVQLVFLGLALPLWCVMVGAFALGMAMEVFMVIWFTAMQANIPRDALSRVSSYDAMGSLMFGPVGLALAGPLAAAIGLQASFFIAAAVTLVAILAALAAPSVWRLRSDAPTD